MTTILNPSATIPLATPAIFTAVPELLNFTTSTALPETSPNTAPTSSVSISDHNTISNPSNALYGIKTGGSIKVTPAPATSTPSISGNAMIHIFTYYFFFCHNIRDG